MFNVELFGQYRYDPVFGVHGNGQGGFLQGRVQFVAQGDGGFVEERFIYFAGGQGVYSVEKKLVTFDQLINEFEIAHHKLHGRDPRGLDPNAGPTRLHPGPQY
jgi:hypothetical protein